MQETRPMDMTEDEARRLDKIRQEFFSFQKGREDEAQSRMDQRLGELNRTKGETLVRRKKIGRNEPCPCGSGRKFKKCCISGLRDR